MRALTADARIRPSNHSTPPAPAAAISGQSAGPVGLELPARTFGTRPRPVLTPLQDLSDE